MSLKVEEFYRGKVLLITGGTGFIGKCLIEKLLYSCSDLKKIFVLIRLKDNKSLSERFDDLVNSLVFGRIRSERVEVMKKLQPICGDLCKPDLGLSREDLHLIATETNIIFNVGASVDFLATVQDAFTSNVLSLRYLIEMTKNMKNLQIISHASTGYCFPGENFVKEKIFDLNFDIDWIFSNDTEAQDKQLIENYAKSGHPSCYSFTKRLSEHVADESYRKSSTPICIVRPTIVFPAFEEPLTGWVDIEINAAGELAALGKGLKMTTLCDKEAILNLMPVDFNVRAMIATAVDAAERIEDMQSTIPVYNINWPISILDGWTVQKATDLMMESVRSMPFLCGLWYPRSILTKSKALHYTTILFFQLIPAYIFDALMWMCNKKPPVNLVARQHQMIGIQKHLFLYALSQIRFQVDNLQAIEDRLENGAAAEFGSFPDDFDMRRYFKIYVEGTRRFILGESVSDIPRAQKQLQIMRAIDVVFRISVLALPVLIVLWLTCSRST